MITKSMNVSNKKPVNPNWVYKNLSDARRVYVDAIVQYSKELGLDVTNMEFSRSELSRVSMKQGTRNGYLIGCEKEE